MNMNMNMNMNQTIAGTRSAHLSVPGSGSEHLDWHVWEAKDGTSVLVRPIEPDDFELERQFVDGLSARSGFQRLLSPRRPSALEIKRWTQVDRPREGVLIATVRSQGEEQQIGVARYAIDGEDGEADFAIVIGDAWHGIGVGAHLVSSLIELARKSGVGQLSGITLSENRAMLGLARRLGFKLSRVPGDGIVTRVSLALHPEA